jgi:hypothetical protein
MTPLAPISPPNLTLVSSASPPGEYRIDFEGTAPVLDGVVVRDDYPPVAFLFKVEDKTMGQVSYIWQVQGWREGGRDGGMEGGGREGGERREGRGKEGRGGREGKEGTKF